MSDLEKLVDAYTNASAAMLARMQFYSSDAVSLARRIQKTHELAQEIVIAKTRGANAESEI